MPNNTIELFPAADKNGTIYLHSERPTLNRRGDYESNGDIVAIGSIFDSSPPFGIKEGQFRRCVLMLASDPAEQNPAEQNPQSKSKPTKTSGANRSIMWPG